MAVFIVGFICALFLAALIVAFIAYYMFIKERHKSELYQHDLSEIQRRNAIVNMSEPNNKKEKEVRTGILILPSRLKQNNYDFIRRPDYPEGPVPTSKPNTEKLIEIIDGCADVHYKDGTYELDSSTPGDSEV